jgi:hypothetical protein
MKAIATAPLVVLVLAAVLPSRLAQAQSAPSPIRTAQATPPEQQPSVRRIRLPVTRLRVYPYFEPAPEVDPRYFPGRNAVRECNATYVQEFRPSGTVIVPRMSCRWRGG